MASDPKSLLPGLIPQNPSSWKGDGQARLTTRQEQVDRVLAVFRQLVPSNYSAQVPGPFYTTQFQAMAERIADFQITAQEVFADSFHQFTRAETLFQILGSLVFPDAEKSGYPDIDGDVTYRTFLRRMVELLLRGATADVQQEGVELLTDATVTIIERGVEARRLKGSSAWGPEDAHVFEVNVLHSVEDDSSLTFDVDPITLQRNAQLVLRALKPAHALYEYRNVFTEAFGEIFSAASQWEMASDYYQDMRRNWYGAAHISGTTGVTWSSNRALFSDPNRDFTNIRPGALLRVTSGVNAGAANTQGIYHVIGVLDFLQDDSTPREYTTSNGLSGEGTVSGSDFTDPDQSDWYTVREGGTLTILTGPNTGTYRIKSVLGADGGAPGKVSGVNCSGLRVAPSILQLRERMKQAATGQSYEVQVDRLGVLTTKTVTEDVTDQFSGVGANRDTFRTSHGPLAKPWGDGSPAGVHDVIVEVDGTPVEIDVVNPYTGTITLHETLTLPQTDVQVTYHWHPLPIHTMGLNTPGLLLGQWDIPTGELHKSGADSNGQQIQDAAHPKGAMPLSIFPMGVVLGPPERPTPLLVGHRYIGFEKEYSALLNSPTTFVLNANPQRPAIPGFETSTVGESVAWEAEASPSSPWTLVGTDAGSLTGGGVYRITRTAGVQTPGDPGVTVWARETDLTFPSTAFAVARFKVVSSTPRGVFTGVGFGLHNNRHLFFAGALSLGDSDDASVEPLQTIGLLKDSSKAHELAGWHIGPLVSGVVQRGRRTVVFDLDDLPMGVLQAGHRFGVINGNQGGSYTIEGYTKDVTSRTATVTITGTFPADPGTYDSNPVSVIFEIPWDDSPSTYRIVLTPETETVQLVVSGAVSTTIISGTAHDSTFQLPAAADSTLFTDASAKGQVVFGHVYPQAASVSDWSFVRYGVVPDQTAVRGFVSAVTNDMGVLPEEDTANEWFPPETFGWRRLTGSGLQINAALPSGLFDTRFGYERIEGFLKPGTTLDLSTTFKVSEATHGWGDAQIYLTDTKREVCLSTLQYFEDVSQTPYRQLVDLPCVAYAGIYSPQSQGLELIEGSAEGATSLNGDLFIQVTDDFEGISFKGSLDTSDIPFADPKTRFFALRFKITESNSEAVLSFAASIHAPDVVIKLAIAYSPGPSIILTDASDVVIGTYAVDWEDADYHDIILRLASDLVTVQIDGTVVGPTLNAADFPGSAEGDFITFGAGGDGGSGKAFFRSVAYGMLPPPGIKRTLGVFRGRQDEARGDIDNWELPRTDSTPAKNSDQTGPTIEEMDWRAFIDVRVFVNDEWGVTVLRPDMGNPPYYDAESSVSGSGFTNNRVEPSAGWINVEYPRLPRVTHPFGLVSFGPLAPSGFTAQTWSDVAYTITTVAGTDYRSPSNMVLNQYNVITSGERETEYEVETVEARVLSPTRVSLTPTHMYASDIYKIVDGATIFTRSQWTFDLETQTVSLNSGYAFTGSSVTVMFTPGKPVTTTYLLNQPLLDSVTLLNDSTPPFPKSRMAAATLVEASPSMSEGDLLAYEDAAETLYEGMDFMEVTNGGWERLIAIAGEGVPGMSGFTPADGDLIYSMDGEGAALANASGHSAGLKATGSKAGGPQGASVISLSGPNLSEHTGSIRLDSVKVVLDGVVRFTTGGFNRGPVVTASNRVLLLSPHGAGILLEDGLALVTEDGVPLIL